MSSVKVGQELMYPDIARAVYSKQTLSYVNPSSGPTSFNSQNGNQQVVRFSVPQQGFLNPKSSYLQFIAYIDNSGGATSPQFRNGIGCLIGNVKIYLGGTIIENCDFYDLFQRMLIDVSAGDERLNSNWQSGCGTNAELQSWATSQRQYILKLDVGLMTQEKLIPMAFLKGDLEIELTFNSTDRACIYQGAAQSCYYKVEQIRLMTEVHSLEQSYVDAVRNALLTSGISLLFPSYEAYTVNLGEGRNDNEIKCNRRSVKGILFLARSGANIASRTTDWAFSTCGMVDFQLDVGNLLYPNNLIPVGAPAMVELQKALGKIGLLADASQLTYANYVSSPVKFYAGLDLETFISQDVLSGMDWSVAQARLITDNTGTPAGSQLTAFVLFDVVVSVTMDGIFIAK